MTGVRPDALAWSICSVMVVGAVVEVADMRETYGLETMRWMIVLAVADLYGISGRRDELLALLDRSERDAADEPGCRRYTFAATLADPDRFVLVSEWESQEAIDAH